MADFEADSRAHSTAGALDAPDAVASDSPGRRLCRTFYREAIRPVLGELDPDLPYAAALLGRGSEVLGFDDAMSTDHNGEARAVIFITEDDAASRGDVIEAALRERLPDRFGGRPTQCELTTIRAYVRDRLGPDLGVAAAAAPTPADWLTMAENNLLMFTGGVVFTDTIGLRAVIARFAYYPDDVWRYLMLAAWWRVHPEVNLVGRTGWVGDELGSAVIAARLVAELMRLCFLQERRYAPYPKWFGTAFSQLRCAQVMQPLLNSVLRAESWTEREEALNSCYAAVADAHNALGVTAPVPTRLEGLWDRPFRVLWGDFPAALRAGIRDPEVRRIADRWPVGGIDQVRELLWPARQQQDLVRLVG